MARAPRLALTGYPYQVVQRGHNRGAVFADDLDRQAYLRDLEAASRLHGLAVHAYVLMDTFVHLLATPLRDQALSRTLQAVGRRYVRAFNHRHGCSGTLWEGRFRSSLVQADRYLLACQRLIETTPVRSGRVAAPADWRWSSHRHHVGWVSDPVVRTHPVVWALGNTPFERESAYRQRFDDLASQPDDEWIESRLESGKPTASTDFQRSLEILHGVRVLTRPVGRPRRSPPRPA